MTKPYVYVVAPANVDPGRAEKRDLVNAACAALGYAAHYPAYDPALPNFDVTRECEIIEGAAFALVDLSFERPSAYYELGLIEALGKRVVLLAEAGTPIHQTSRRVEVRRYRDLDEFDAVVREALSGVGKG